MSTLTDTPHRILMKLGIVATRAEASRLVHQGAMKFNDVPVTSCDDEITVKDGDVIRVGRRKVIEITQLLLDWHHGYDMARRGVSRVALSTQELNDPHFMEGFNSYLSYFEGRKVV